MRLRRSGMPLSLACSLAACSLLAPAAPLRVSAAQDPIPLESIMADPTWIGRHPEAARWEEDGESLWYRSQLPDLAGSEWVRIDLAGRELERVDSELARRRFARSERSPDGTRTLLERDGDLYLRESDGGVELRLTRTEVREADAAFLVGAQRIVYRRGDGLFVRDLVSGLEHEAAVLLLEDPPEDEPPGAEAQAEGGFLAEQQERLFDHVRAAKLREAADERREDDAERLLRESAPPRFHLGSGFEGQRAFLAPDEGHLLVRLDPSGSQPGERDTMPRYVTRSGMVETSRVRPKVGTGTRAGHALVLLDLRDRSRHDIALDGLSAIADDPLAELRAGARTFRERLREAGEPAAPARGEEGGGVEPDAAPAAPPVAASDEPGPMRQSEPTGHTEPGGPRPVAIQDIAWNESGTHALARASTFDNKDDWLFLIDAERRALIEVDHQSEPTWINDQLRDIGWLAGGRSLWYVSEADGWAHLRRYDLESADSVDLTHGEWEVSDVRASADGRWIFFVANPEHPGRHELYRVPAGGGPIEALTRLGGRNEGWLSPDEGHWLILHSEVLAPPELYLQENRPGAEPLRLTDSSTPEFRSAPWIEPEVVPLPARHGRPVWSRLWRPSPSADPGPGRRPAVLFVHGAGYLQDAHLGWSYYFREFMFHSLLAHRGYVVLDMDYRASAGYGKAWRTAIYRRMGEPELEDLADGRAWLVEHEGVDAERVGIYGGSYGGFLTLMALFREPRSFACGAALRPVTDWAHYNHAYTANILNTPQDDPEAYWRSSPIEHAAGLERPLLLCHGMLDDNVLFQDTVRLAQRLIELGKRDWEVAMYPVEAHAFREPASWLDEYQRILALFERHCRGMP